MRPIAFVVGAILGLGPACSSPSALSPSQNGAAGSADASGGAADTAGGQLIGPQGGSIPRERRDACDPRRRALVRRDVQNLRLIRPGGARLGISLRFLPDVTFATPVTITIPMYGAFPDAHLYWFPPTNDGLVDSAASCRASRSRRRSRASGAQRSHVALTSAAHTLV